MDAAEPSLSGVDPSGLLGVPSPTTARFRALVSCFMSPAQSFRLHSYKDGEAQLREERSGKPPRFLVIVNSARDDERSLRIRLTRLASENLSDQHIVLVANHGWMGDALTKFTSELRSKLRLYQLTADGALAVRPRGALAPLLTALKTQKSAPGSTLSEPEFAAQCEDAEAQKQRIADRYDEALLRRSTPFSFLLAALILGLFVLTRLWKSPDDSATVLVQLGARVLPFVRAGEWWRLLASSFLNPGVPHLGLAALLALALGHQAEKLLGTAQVVTLYTVSAVLAGLCGMYLPGPASRSIGVGTSGALWGVLAAMAVLAQWPEGLPIAVAQRLRKIVLAGGLLGVVLTFLPSVDRAAHLGGAVGGALLMLSGALRPLRIGDAAQPPSSLRVWVERGLGAVCAVVLFGSLATAFIVGKPWQPDRTWKRRLGGAGQRTGVAGSGLASTSAASAEDAAAGNQAEAAPKLVRRTLGEAGYSILLPEGLGDARPLSDAGKVPLFQFGDLGGQLQALDVLVQRPQRPFKNNKQLRQALEQSVALLRADKLKGEASELTPAATTELDGQPMSILHLRLQESVQGRGLVLARRDAVIVLWSVYSDLLPENAQLDLTRAAQSVKDEFAGYGPARGSRKKKHR